MRQKMIALSRIAQSVRTTPVLKVGGARARYRTYTGGAPRARTRKDGIDD